MGAVPGPLKSVTHYEVISELGRGGMGHVYKARDLRLDRLVAIKFLAPHLTASSEALARFRREANVISKLNHPNIATIFEMDEHEGMPFLVLEYLPGGTLHARLLGRRLALQEILVYARQLAAGLAHAHRHSIVHRDIKPGNALFSGEGHLKIVDFGLAKLRGSEDVTGAGLRLGTAAYMAPEQAQGGDVDHRADIFALGTILYEMATGHLPFRADRTEGVVHQLLHTTPPLVRSLRPDLLESYERIVLRAMEKNPERRYQKMNELMRDMEATAAEAGVPPIGESPQSELPTQTFMAPTSAPRQPTVTLTVSRRTLWGLGVAAVAVVLLAVSLLVTPAARTVRRWMGGAPEQQQLAVLSFANIGGVAANQAFCEGLAEELTSLLSQMEQFQKAILVVPGSEVRRVRAESVRDARKALNVNLVVTGSVSRTADEIKVIVNLNDAERVRQIASRIVGVRMKDAGGLQSVVVSALLEMLQVQVQPQGEKLLAAATSRNPRAYEHYLQGLGHLAQRSGQAGVDQAIQALDQSVKLEPGYVAAKVALADALLRKFTMTKDNQWLARADQIAAEAVATNDRLASVHVTLGAVRDATGHYEEATREYQRAIDIEPFNAEAHRLQAGIYDKLGRVADAEAAFQKAVRLKPGHWPTYSSQGKFYFTRGEFKKAEEPLRLVVELAPENPVGYRNLGGLYVVMGRYEEATRLLTRSIEMEPSGQAFSNLGFARFFQGQFALAADSYEKAVKHFPKNAAIWSYLGEARWQLPPRREESIQAFRQAVELADAQLAVNPNTPDLLGTKAYCLTRLDRGPEARGLMVKAVALASEDYQLLYKAARVFEILGDREKALDFAAQAMSRGYPLRDALRDPDLERLRRDARWASLAARAAKK